MQMKDKAFRTKSHFLCFNCVFPNHKGSQCRHKNKGPSCFNYLNFCHTSGQCDQPKMPKIKSETSNISTFMSNTFMTKHINFSFVQVISLVKSGSDRSLLKESIYRKLRANLNFEHSTMRLTGLGNIIPYSTFASSGHPQ